MSSIKLIEFTRQSADWIARSDSSRPFHLGQVLLEVLVERCCSLEEVVGLGMKHLLEIVGLDLGAYDAVGAFLDANLETLRLKVSLQLLCELLDLE